MSEKPLTDAPTLAGEREEMVQAAAEAAGKNKSEQTEQCFVTQVCRRRSTIRNTVTSLYC